MMAAFIVGLTIAYAIFLVSDYDKAILRRQSDPR